MDKKRIAVLGATGSIGTQCLEVISNHPNKFKAEVLTAQNNIDVLINQAIKHKPFAVVIANSLHYKKLKEALAPFPIKVFAGSDALNDIVSLENIDLVFNALVGFSGLTPTLNALRLGKSVALANKESLVAGGDLITKAALATNTPILPVDSEHSAIFQCMLGEKSRIEKIVLTASGGPFFRTPIEEFPLIGKEQALKHPNWNMGEKVSIDSASMMNKGLEVIEAHWLFEIAASKIDVIIHPQSIIHSMVQFEDGSLKAQLSYPDMRIPIQFALSYPERLILQSIRIDFSKLSTLDFCLPNTEKFPCLALAYHALLKGGNTPCTLNAANEVAVRAFLYDQIPFHHIPIIIEKTIETIHFIPQPTFADINETNIQASLVAQNLLKNS